MDERLKLTIPAEEIEAGAVGLWQFDYGILAFFSVVIAPCS